MLSYTLTIGTKEFPTTDIADTHHIHSRESIEIRRHMHVIYDKGIREHSYSLDI